MADLFIHQAPALWESGFWHEQANGFRVKREAINQSRGKRNENQADSYEDQIRRTTIQYLYG